MKDDKGSPIPLEDSAADEGMGAVIWGIAAIVAGAILGAVLIYLAMR